MKTKIIEKIKEFNTIIIHRHVRPDPDAIGSQAGLAEMIKASFPDKQVYIVGEEEQSLTFLEEMDTISDDMYQGALVIICDTANVERISDERYSMGNFIIKIDHHPNEDPYGDLIWVDTSASSVSEMICQLHEAGKNSGFVLNQKAARLLYAGIVGDTGRFRFPNTTEHTFRFTSELVKVGFSRTELYEQLYKKNLKVARFEGYILQKFQVTDAGVGIMNLPKELLEEFHVSTSEASQLVNTFSNVEGLTAWVFFVEEADGELIRVRLRSKGPQINQIAAQFGGGGHPLAAGASVTAWEDTTKVVELLEEVCSNWS
ncbi:DHH family phosphoesterase [Anaerobacillus sp. MEB173]|uniref:DHH family phosphoesterase n=1 Tax=Anaerobacillus sp. MEB173 TaxID=3383345 RepID=UPI003F91459C